MIPVIGALDVSFITNASDSHINRQQNRYRTIRPNIIHQWRKNSGDGTIPAKGSSGSQ
ncbi:MAG TPA: hypothetical protein VER35_02315 [Candidatus Limnocylindrales bacterium]|nr:hypothetical protein [Candidatus Limnocylindrales bacterium]